ncbi:MAG: lytic transglycosylase domain-containing protein [Treponema sp.]|jgi:soluble lytic murein transglycosylase-like protein|nr:lytic transglycosylase domain-containing protein [Treponema sp.]
MKRKIYKIDLAYPFFCGMVVSAFICVFAIFPRISAYLNRSGGQNEASREAESRPDEILPEAAASPAPAVPLTVQLSLAAESFPAGEDKILKAYRDPAGRDYVTAFFGNIVHSQELAQIILANADVFNIAPSLAFALCWEESRFKIRATSQKNRNGSVDRGLFQLNDKSFPHLSEKDFFDPRISSHYGLSHLRWCLDTGGSLVAGLAMYNAGTNRVSSGSTPKMTLDYVSNILNTKNRIDAFFEEHRPNPAEIALAVQEEETEPQKQQNELPRRPRLALLSPAL